MPALFREKLNASLSIEVWTISESEAFFHSFLATDAERSEEISALRNEKRRLERLACRAALTDLVQHFSLPLSITDLHYAESGAPVLHGPWHISFSHSNQYAAVAVSTETRVGIDIERKGGRILKLSDKILNEEEKTWCDLSSPDELYYCWCGKEAIYKIVNTPRFPKDITINPIHKQTGFIKTDDGLRSFRLFRKEMADCCLVIATDQ